MKKIFLFLLMLFLGDLVFAQVNSYIGIVRPQKNENELKFDQDKKDDMLKQNSSKSKKKDEKKEEKKEDDEEEEEEDNKEKENQGYDKKINVKAFGSGFIYVDSKGTSYVITNKHVVGDAELACFELVDPESGKKTLYDDLKVLAVSESLDIAIIYLGKKEIKEGFEFYKGNLSDGTEVYSAGFPSLRNKPSWQFAKGNISNSKTDIKELIDPELSYVIQHSAPIDSGNSGGPLLIPDSSAKLGYKVVGINTWKSRNRELAGFTIPAPTIENFIKTALTSSKDNEKDVTKDAEDFIKNLSKTYDYDYSSDFGGQSTVYKDVGKYISNEYACSITYEQFKNINSFLQVSSWYYDGVNSISDRKAALSRLIVTKYREVNKTKKSEKIRFYKYKIDKVTLNKDMSYSIVFTCKEDGKDNTLESVWINEFGLWRIKSISLTAGSTDYKKEKTYNINKDHLDKGFITVDTNVREITTYGVTYPVFADSGNLDDYYIGAFYNTMQFSNFSSEDKYPLTATVGFDWQYKEGINHLFFNIGVTAAFNINFGTSFVIVPYASAFVLLDFITTNPAGGWGWNSGLVFRYMKKQKSPFYVRVFYQDNFVYSLRKDQGNYRYGTVGAGFGFNISLF